MKQRVIGFMVADENKTADISSWGGICLTYTSDASFRVYLVSELGDESDHNTKPHAWFAALLDPESPMTKCVQWHDFTVLKNGSSDIERYGDEDAKKAKVILIKFEGSSGEQKNFNIKSLGTYDERLLGRS
ncbi:hypothetical protein B7990_09420 [Fibrobacter sp. UWB4]|uniref:hypothetical protein n=1 Tax=Fibrobacter sp. UWB4 TaxID=1964356 RepID=UPI000B52331C|nr:hypothetical protein [Fibrobacter sp. UWB4]OWV17700.1 hypothetical protein B7990_09420 [Fibrobacter sp. UWB4]